MSSARTKSRHMYIWKLKPLHDRSEVLGETKQLLLALEAAVG